jgi:hypothetical protein
MTHAIDSETLRYVLKGLCDIVREYVGRSLDARCAPLEARIKELEARGELKYCGVWREGDEYARGNFVTTSGSLWHAEANTTSRPGTDSTWRLAVKQGMASR